jgi:hypothetical protein
MFDLCLEIGVSIQSINILVVFANTLHNANSGFKLKKMLTVEHTLATFKVPSIFYFWEGPGARDETLGS